MKSTFRFMSNLVFIFFLLILLFAYAMYQGGFVSWFIFFGYLPIFIYHLGLLFYPINRWQVTRALSNNTVSAGSNLSVTVTIKRRIPFPIYYCILEEVTPESLNKVDHLSEKFKYMDNPGKLKVKRQLKQIKFPWFKRVIKFTYDIDHIPRGAHVLNRIRVKTADVFGFISKESLYTVTDELLAHPDQRAINLRQKLSSFSEGPSSSQSLHFKQTNVASSIREYVAGDKFSWIHWKQTARQNKMITKEFEQERSTDTLLILDHCDYQGMNELAFEGAIEVGIALITLLEAETSGIEVLTIGAETTHFPFRADSVVKDSLRKYMAQACPSLDQPFSVKLKEATIRFKGELLTIIVTTHIDLMLKETLKRLKKRMNKVTVFHIQSVHKVSIEEQDLIEQLRHQGIIIYQLTEKELVENPIEVSL